MWNESHFSAEHPLIACRESASKSRLFHPKTISFPFSEISTRNLKVSPGAYVDSFLLSQICLLLWKIVDEKFAWIVGALGRLLGNFRQTLEQRRLAGYNVYKWNISPPSLVTEQENHCLNSKLDSVCLVSSPLHWIITAWRWGRRRRDSIATDSRGLETASVEWPSRVNDWWPKRSVSDCHSDRTTHSAGNTTLSPDDRPEASFKWSLHVEETAIFEFDSLVKDAFKAASALMETKGAPIKIATKQQNCEPFCPQCKDIRPLWVAGRSLIIVPFFLFVTWKQSKRFARLKFFPWCHWNHALVLGTQQHLSSTETGQIFQWPW